MRSTGGLLMKQMLIQYLTKQFVDAATLHDSESVVEANDESLPHDHQPTTSQLRHDPDVAANKISQHACNQLERKA